MTKRSEAREEAKQEASDKSDKEIEILSVFGCGVEVVSLPFPTLYTL